MALAHLGVARHKDGQTERRCGHGPKLPVIDVYPKCVGAKAKLRLAVRNLRDESVRAARVAVSPVAPNLKLMTWRPPAGGDNFGDALGPPICEAQVQRLGRSVDRPATRRRLWTVGSVLHRTRAGDVVWGSGANGNALGHNLARSVDIRAVRGPLTAQWVADQGRPAPTVFGDPALLLPTLMPEFVRTEDSRSDAPTLLVPHMDDMSTAHELATDAVLLVSPFGPWRDCVAALASARLVVASSLHALIVAEAFGVPARMLRVSEREPTFKYRDYYESTGRSDFAFARSLAEALEMGGERPGHIDLAPLLAAFPIELWH